MPLTIDKKWSIYIVENRLNQFYTGICRNLTRRFDEHSANGKLCAKALRGKAPLKLIYAADVDNHSTALKAEIWIKKLPKNQKVQLVKQELELAFAHSRHSDKYLHKIMDVVSQPAS